MCHIDNHCKLDKKYTIQNVSKTWKFVISLTPEKLLLFEKKTGVGRIMHVAADQARVIKDAKADSKKWTQCEFVPHNRQVFFFNSGNGQAVYYNWDAEHSNLSKMYIVDSGWSGVRCLSQSF